MANSLEYSYYIMSQWKLAAYWRRDTKNVSSCNVYEACELQSFWHEIWAQILFCSWTLLWFFCSCPAARVSDTWKWSVSGINPPDQNHSHSGPFMNKHIVALSTTQDWNTLNAPNDMETAQLPTSILFKRTRKSFSPLTLTWHSQHVYIGTEQWGGSGGQRECICVYVSALHRDSGKTEFALDQRTADTAACANRRAEKREVWQKRGIS